MNMNLPAMNMNTTELANRERILARCEAAVKAAAAAAAPAPMAAAPAPMAAAGGAASDTRIGDAAHLAGFEARLADPGSAHQKKWQKDAAERAAAARERAAELKQRQLKQAIAAYRRTHDRSSLALVLAKERGVSLIQVLAELDGKGHTKTKSAITKLRNERVMAKFGVLKA